MGFWTDYKVILISAPLQACFAAVLVEKGPLPLKVPHHEKCIDTRMQNFSFKPAYMLRQKQINSIIKKKKKKA